MYRWIEDRAPYLLCAALWNRSSTLSSNDTYAEVPSAQCQKRKARLTFRTKKAGLSPHLFLREMRVGSMCRFRFLLSPFSSLRHFSLFPVFIAFPGQDEMTLKSPMEVCVCGWSAGGSHPFRSGTSHPFLGISHTVSESSPDSVGDFGLGSRCFLGTLWGGETTLGSSIDTFGTSHPTHRRYVGSCW